MEKRCLKFQQLILVRNAQLVEAFIPIIITEFKMSLYACIVAILTMWVETRNQLNLRRLEWHLSQRGVASRQTFCC